MTFVVHHGDCREVMATLDAESVDAVVCDPPYGLSFMGKGWDHGVPGEEFWTEALRLAKPGAHLLAFGGTRTYHRLACAIEDAGWEIRDCVMWVYGSGFPKSHDVSKAIDKAAGAERPRVPGGQGGNNAILGARKSGEAISGEAISGEAIQWSGWGTALKPAWEPIIVARKPLCGTVAENVLTHGTGGINVDACRVGANGDKLNGGRVSTKKEGWDRPWKHDAKAVADCIARGTAAVEKAEQLGRWPANLIHDGSEEVVGLFPEQQSGPNPRNRGGIGYHSSAQGQSMCHAPRGADSGSAARFFYCAKASKADRDEGCDGIDEKTTCYMATANGTGRPSVTVDDTGKDRDRFSASKRNHHPTVKPTALMRYLCRLVTPPGGAVLDPFAGSGSTGKAAVCEGFDFVGIEREAEYVEIARARIAAAVLPLEATA
jgi:site-specific DNA-methyltransferase (adenine-specific)